MLVALMAMAVIGGGLPTKRLVARLWSVDLEAVGTRNPGAGNATGSVGLRAGILVAVLDGLKGLVPVLIGRSLDFSDGALAVIGVLSVVGNNWPVLGGRGGRGLAASVGVVVGLAPWLIVWPGVWSAIGWRIGGAIAGFVGWGLLPFVAIITGASEPVIALTVGLAIAMAVRRAQGNDGYRRGMTLSRVLFDDDRHAGVLGGVAPSLIVWMVLVSSVYLIGGWWAIHGGSLGGIGVRGVLLLILAVAFEFGAKWAFGELFREGLIGENGGSEVGRAAAFRAALIGSGVARLIPAGGAVTPVAMAWAVRDDAPAPAGAAVRATMLNYAGLLVGTGGAMLWVLWRFPSDLSGVGVGLIGTALLLAGSVVATGAGRLTRLARRVPRRWRDRVQRTMVDRSINSHTVMLVVVRVVAESFVLGLSLLAFAVHLAPSQVIAAFGISQLVGGLPGTPGGVGVTEAGLAGALALFGAGSIVAPVLAFRIVSYWLPAAAGISVGGYTFLRTREAAGTG